MPERRSSHPVPRTAAALLRELLDKTARAVLRLRDDADVEALHDFRVALRRLHTNLRAWRDSLDPAVSRPAKQLRRLARATNAARDREVQLDWLRSQRAAGGARQGRWLTALVAALEGDDVAHKDAERAGIIADFTALAAELRQALRRRAPAGAEPFLTAANRQLRKHSARLVRRLAAIDGVEDAAAAHEARIAGKRLRYVLEPLAGAVPGAPGLIKRLKVLQDVLGGLHDCEVRLETFACDDTVLRRRTEQQRARLFATLRTDWLGRHIDELDQALQRLRIPASRRA